MASRRCRRATLLSCPPPPPPAPLQVPTKVARGINQVPTKLAYGVKALADGDDNKEQMVSDVFPKPEAA